MSTLYFADSNIWLYRLLENQALDAQEAARKRGIAIALTEANGILISTQVVNEICVNLIRKAAFDEMQIQGFVRSLSNYCTIVTLETATLLHASELRSAYRFSFWDSLIVASALIAKAEILYSEDMQHNQSIENKLRIINPFLASL